MVDEKGMAAAMKADWKKEGYKVAVDGFQLILSGTDWLVRMDLQKAPRKVLGLLAEHMGLLPRDGEAFRVAKDEPCQNLVAEMEVRDAEKVFCRVTLANCQPARYTGLRLNGIMIFQNPETGAIEGVLPELVKLLDTVDPGRLYLHAEDGLYSMDDGCCIYFAGENLLQEKRAHLEAFQWVAAEE